MTVRVGVGRRHDRCGPHSPADRCGLRRRVVAVTDVDLERARRQADYVGARPRLRSQSPLTRPTVLVASGGPTHGSTLASIAP
jgi:hypothetical protein